MTYLQAVLWLAAFLLPSSFLVPCSISAELSIMCHVMVASSVYGRSHKRFGPGSTIHPFLPLILANDDHFRFRRNSQLLEAKGKNGELEALGNFLAAELSFQGSDTRR